MLNWSPPQPRRSPLSEAIDVLQRDGKQVAQADIPGLFFVDHQELTINQVIDFARQIRKH